MLLVVNLYLNVRKYRRLGVEVLGERSGVVMVFTANAVGNFCVQACVGSGLPVKMEVTGFLLIYLGLNIIQKSREDSLEDNSERRTDRESQAANHNQDVEENSKKPHIPIPKLNLQ